MVASGVRNSCEAVETNFDFISESSFSRCTAASASTSARLLSSISTLTPVMRSGRPPASRSTTLPRPLLHTQPPASVLTRCTATYSDSPPFRQLPRACFTFGRSSGCTICANSSRARALVSFPTLRMIAQVPSRRTLVLRASQSQIRILAASSARSSRSFCSLTCSSKSSFSRLKRSVSISAWLEDTYSARSTAENTRIRIPAEVLNAPPSENRHDQAGEGLGAGCERRRQAHRDAADEEREEDFVKLGALRIEQHHRQAPGGTDQRAGEAEEALPARCGLRSRPAQAVGAIEEDADQARQHQPDQPGDEQLVADIAPKAERSDRRSQENRRDVVPRQPVEERHPLRQEFGRGYCAERGAGCSHVFLPMGGETGRCPGLWRQRRPVILARFSFKATSGPNSGEFEGVGESRYTFSRLMRSGTGVSRSRSAHPAPT